MKGYFDNAATTYKKPDGMYDFMAQYMETNGANIGRGSYKVSTDGADHLLALRRKILSLTSAPETTTVVILPSATIALNTIIFGINLQKGDVVYISHFEHNAVLRPLYALQRQKGIQIKILPMHNEKVFEFDFNQIEKDFSMQKPKAVIISQVSNVIGLVAPVERIAEMAKRYGAIVTVDAAQSCGVLGCNLANIDYYVFAGHKTLLGPYGIGGFVCNRNCALQPLFLGGTGIDSANAEMPKSVPERFEAGSVNLMAVIGLEYSIDWIITHSKEAQESEKVNIEKLYNILKEFDYLEAVTPYPKSSGIISCKVVGYTSNEFSNILAEHGIAVRGGLHCAPESHRYLKTFPEGLVRFSVSCLTDDRDFIMLDRVLHELEGNL